MILNKSKILLYILLLCIVSLFYYRYCVLLPRVEKEGKYTIGEVTEYRIKKGGSYNVFFTFVVKGKKFKNYSNASFELVENLKIGNRFLVVFLENDNILGSPGIILDNPVPDSVLVTPPDGWKSKPEWAK
ncbi:hypothetical protein V3470_14685 [Flavobacterium oreochromis]|uniref:hypothetical protein n=1 Tax=Flavobacterium oreochromis TaxID=2906078 RepID=UPI000B64273B|nr:hypothetical protein BWG23_15150 [Flavobacterium oreochromis]